MEEREMILGMIANKVSSDKMNGMSTKRAFENINQRSRELMAENEITVADLVDCLVSKRKLIGYSEKEIELLKSKVK